MQFSSTRPPVRKCACTARRPASTARMRGPRVRGVRTVRAQARAPQRRDRRRRGRCDATRLLLRVPRARASTRHACHVIGGICGICARLRTAAHGRRRRARVVGMLPLGLERRLARGPGLYRARRPAAAVFASKTTSGAASFSMGASFYMGASPECLLLRRHPLAGQQRRVPSHCMSMSMTTSVYAFAYFVLCQEDWTRGDAYTSGRDGIGVMWCV